MFLSCHFSQLNYYFCFIDMSNDELDDELNSSSKARGKFLKTLSHHNMITKQRSLTPDKITEEQIRSLTPDKFRMKNGSDGSQGSLFVKHSSSSSRGSTLERPQFEDKLPISSRSSSSSSYSGGDNENNGFRRRTQDRQVSRNNENRIRRSR